MMEENEKIEGREREDIFSRAVKAGKRTYFFDVKATKGNDYYLTITERKKRFESDGHFHVEKHKIFLYKEDFEKFSDGLSDVIEYIKEAVKNPQKEDVKPQKAKSFTNVDFEDLEKN
jgi:hypothetical protein